MKTETICYTILVIFLVGLGSYMVTKGYEWLGFFLIVIAMCVKETKKGVDDGD